MRRQAIRLRDGRGRYLGGEAKHLPLAESLVQAAWLSTVIHHVANLPARAREVGRVVAPGAHMLIQSSFPGRHADVTLFRRARRPYSPEDSVSRAGSRRAMNAAASERRARFSLRRMLLT